MQNKTVIKNAMDTDRTQTNQSGWLGFFTSLPATGTALLPAAFCPACWPAYTGLLGSLGLGFINYGPWLMPVTAFFLLIALTTLGVEAYKRQFFWPFIIGLNGAAILMIGKFLVRSDPVLYSGIALIIGASIWTAWPRPSCPMVEQKPNFGSES